MAVPRAWTTYKNGGMTFKDAMLYCLERCEDFFIMLAPNGHHYVIRPHGLKHWRDTQGYKVVSTIKMVHKIEGKRLRKSRACTCVGGVSHRKGCPQWVLPL